MGEDDKEAYMKRFLFLVAAVTLFCSCGPALKEDGSFGKEEFIGKFRGTSIYCVTTPDGGFLYVGITDGGVVNSISTSEKNPKHTILIDGKEVNREKALDILKND